MKKCISVILALCLALSCVLPVYAAPAAAAAPDTSVSGESDKTPILVVSGMGALPFWLDEGTPQQTECFPPNPDIPKIVWRALGGLFRTIVTFDLNPFANVAADIALEMLGVMACDADGNSLYAVTPVLVEGAMSTYPPSQYEGAGSAEFAIVNCAVQAVGADHAYFYNYDWRLDPLTNADNLNAYIDRILRETGHDKVRLAAISMGGVQTMAYLYKYGHDKIERIWFLSAAYCGLLFVTNIFTGEIQFSQKSIFSWLQTLTVGSEKTDAVFDRCMDWCGRTALLRPVFRLVNNITNKVNSIVVDRVIRRTLSTMPGMWAFVRDDRYEEAKKAMLPENASDKFIERIDEYHYNVLCKREQILKSAEADGVQIAVVSHRNGLHQRRRNGRGLRLDAARRLHAARVQSAQPSVRRRRDRRVDLHVPRHDVVHQEHAACRLQQRFGICRHAHVAVLAGHDADGLLRRAVSAVFGDGRAHADDAFSRKMIE